MTVVERVAVPLLLLLVTALPVSAQSGDGSISGQIVNKTSGGDPPAGISVRLVTFGRKEDAALGERTVQSDANGHYAFTGLDRNANLVYVPFARYANVTYRPDELGQLQDQADSQLDITVYESTADDTALHFDRLNLLLQSVDQGMLNFVEMGALSNGGDRTFVAADPRRAEVNALRLPLPSRALGVQMQSGFTDQDLVSGTSAVQVTGPLEPGVHEFALSFQLPVTGSTADLTLRPPYETGDYSVYVPDTGVRLNTRDLESDGSIVLGQQTYAVYGASNLSRNATVSAQLAGVGSSPTRDLLELLAIGLAVVLLVFAGGTVLFVRRTRSRRTTSATLALEPGAADERLELVMRMAVLDERFAAGQVRRAEYEAVRDLTRRRLRQLTSTRPGIRE